MDMQGRVRIVQLYRLCKYSSALDNYEDFNPACLVWSQSIAAATSWHCLPRLTGCWPKFWLEFVWFQQFGDNPALKIILLVKQAEFYLGIVILLKVRNNISLCFHFLWLIFWKNYILFLVQNLWEQISFLRKLSWLMIIILIGKLVNNIFDNLLIFHKLNMHKLSLLK